MFLSKQATTNHHDMSSFFPGVSSVMPGFSVGPSAPPTMGLNGPNISAVQWAPRGPTDGVSSVMQAFQGGIPGVSHIHSTLPSNDFISTQFTIKPWTDDNAHLKIREHMLVFISTQMDPQVRDLVNMVALPKMNQVLREQYHLFEKFGASRYRDFYEAIQTVSESHLEAAIRNRDLAKDSDDLQLLVGRYRENVLRYQTAVGIMNSWRFMGGVVSVDTATSGEDMFTYDDADKVSSIGVIIGKRCDVGNIWGGKLNGGNVDVGSTLWLILRRRENPDGSFGAFQFYPYATKGRTYPPASLLKYKDRSGEWQQGKVLYIGVVTEGNQIDPNRGWAEAAAGLGINNNIDTAFDAHGNLPLIQVQIGI